MAVTARKPGRLVPVTGRTREVAKFCADQKILPHVRKAILIARSSFRPIKRLEVRLQPDPDFDEQRIVIDVYVAADIPSVLSMKREYTSRWIEAAPFDAQQHIRLLYQIV